MADIVLTNELYITYDSLTIACTTSFNLTVEKASNSLSCMGGNGWNSNYVGNKNWSLEFESILKRTDSGGDLIYSDLMDSLINTNEIVTCGLPSTILTDRYQQGEAQLISLVQTGTADDVVKYTGVLQGYEALYIVQPGVSLVFPFTFPFILT